jgi:hypothetical protein
MRTEGRTDERTNCEMTKLIVDLLNFSITPNNCTDTTPTCFGKIYHLQEIYVQLQMILQVLKLSKYFSPGCFFLEPVLPEGDISLPKHVRVVSLLSMCT